MSDNIHNILAKYFNGEVTAEESEAVQQWIAASEENRADFELLQKLWNRSGEHEEINFNTEKAWRAVHAKTRGRVVNLFTRRAAIAAAVAIVLLGLWWLIGRNSTTITVYADTAIKEVRLQDGSEVFLRKGATLRYPRKFNREVSLDGEAFFEVKRDTTKRFRINAGPALAEVLGTSFTVNTNNNKVELIVKTGLVRFSGAGQVHLVPAGEKALLAQNTITQQPNTDPNFNAWQSKELAFNNTPLPQVARTLSDYYSVNITLNKTDSAQLSGAKLTARFNNQSLSSVLEEISLITSYHINKVSEDNYEISIK